MARLRSAICRVSGMRVETLTLLPDGVPPRRGAAKKLCRKRPP